MDELNGVTICTMNKGKQGGFEEKSYKSHESHMREYLRNKKMKKHSETWMLDGTVDAWRHERMYRSINPLLKSYPGAYWLTVGDGRYGTDAHFLEKSGSKAVSTDISDSLLRIGKQRNYISSYRKENAEKLSFKDNSFDFVLCKESFHHFPRPMVAFYEMVRVARKGIVLIEPSDSPSVFQSGMMKLLKGSVLSPLGGFFNSFENAGNYVYKISLREIEKASIGLQFRKLAYLGFDDFYLNGVEYINASKFSFTFLKIKFALLAMDVLYKLGLRGRALTTVVVFKDKPTEAAEKRLVRAGFSVMDLPLNPYLTR